MTVFILNSAPWIKFLLSQIYISIAAGIGDNTYIARKNRQFYLLLKEEKSPTEHTRSSTFTLSETLREAPFLRAEALDQ